MKRTLTGIAAASMVLGTFAPMALASSSSSPNYNHREISVGSYSVSANGIAAKDPWTGASTEFMPVWYLKEGLQSLGYKVTWNGTNQTLNITTPSGSTAGLTAVTPGTKGVVISINGVPVVNAPHSLSANDPATKKPTAFLPIFYFVQALKQIGFTSTYNGTAGTWTVTPPAAPAPAPATTGVSGFVTGPDSTGKVGPIAGATVTVGNTTVTTDKNGYYNIAAAPGNDKVTVSAKGYFASTTNVPVTANQFTGNNVSLTLVDPKTLETVVTVDNKQSGAAVSGATVAIENASGTVLATGTTHADGVVTFGNSSVSGGDNLVHFTKYGQTVDQLEANTAYKLVVTDNFGAKNLHDAYHESDVTVTTSSALAETDTNVALTPVKQADVSATVGWNSNIKTLPTGAVVATLMDATGTPITSATATLAASGTTVSEDFGTLSIPSGNYIVEINDGKNAIELKGVTVTEGNDSSTSVTVNPAQQLNVNGEYSQYPTGETPTGTVTLSATETINGQAITVESTTGKVAPVTAGSTQFEATGTLTRLDAGTYTVSASGTYVLGNPSTNATVVAGQVGTTNVSMLPAADLVENVQVPGMAAYSAVPVTVTVVDANGKTLTSSTTALNTGSITATGSASVSLQVPEGTYTIEVSAPGYKTITESGKSLKDFTTTTESQKLTANASASTTLSGYVRFADNSQPAYDYSSGTVSLYTLTGSYVSGTTTTIAANGAYTIPGTLTPGSYEIVARGPGKFDTAAEAISITQGTNTDAIWVNEGGQAADYVTVFNSDGSLYTGAVSPVAYDAWYDPNSKSAGQAGSYTFYGWYGYNAQQPGVYEATDLPAGSYTVSLSGTTTTFQVASDATAKETLTLPSTAVNGPKYEVSGSVMNFGGSSDTIEVAALNSQGQVVAYQTVTSSTGYGFDLAVPNGSYTIVAIDSGYYVASQQVTVDNVPVVLPSNFSLNRAYQ